MSEPFDTQDTISRQVVSLAAYEDALDMLENMTRGTYGECRAWLEKRKAAIELELSKHLRN